MTKLILVRHAQSVANVNLIAEGGGGDSHLTEEGSEQARRLGHYLHTHHDDIDHIYSSPQVRAHDTAKRVAHLFELEIQLEHDLREGMLGDWEGSPPTRELDWDKLNNDPHFDDHGGESPFQLGLRSGQQMQEIAQATPGRNHLDCQPRRRAFTWSRLDSRHGTNIGGAIQTSQHGYIRARLARPSP